MGRIHSRGTSKAGIQQTTGEPADRTDGPSYNRVRISMMGRVTI